MYYIVEEYFALHFLVFAKFSVSADYFYNGRGKKKLLLFKKW